MERNTRNTEYFSLDNLAALSRVDEHLSFVKGIAKKYRHMEKHTHRSGAQAGNFEEDWGDICRQIKLIRKKKDDGKFNISVIGEFATGKSTFINALLRRELLVSSALQGTTAASTVIDHCGQHEVVLEYLDGRPDEKISYGCFQELQKGLERFTTDSSAARLLRSVNVFLPADILKNNFCIIDTPGTNVTEAWHEDVTVRTIKERSDLSVILISAEKLVSNTMIKFVRENLEAVLPQCVFVVTKLDNIRPGERAGQLSYIKMRLEEELEIRDAVVLPYVSPMVLGSESHDSEKAAVDDGLLRMSLETEQKLLQHTTQQRTLVVTKKLTQLTSEIYNAISRQMKRSFEDCENRLRLLDRSQKADLNLFLRQEKVERLQHFNEEMKVLSEDIEQSVSAEAARACTAVVGNLDDKASLDLIKAYINDSLGDDCRRQAENLISGADGYYRQIQRAFEKEMRRFQDSFRKIYRSLNIIPLDMSHSKFEFPQKPEMETANIVSTANYIADELKSENRIFWGGAAAGAAIGTAVVPGVGTVIGGVIGMLIGAPSDANTAKVREECKNKLRPQLTNYYNSISETVISAVDRYINRMRNCLSDEIDEYLIRYRSEADRQIAREKERRRAIDVQAGELKKDMKSIQNRKKQLDSVIVQLNNFGRKEYQNHAENIL